MSSYRSWRAILDKGSSFLQCGRRFSDRPLFRRDDCILEECRAHFRFCTQVLSVHIATLGN
jgi:hypothetical protein